MGQPFSFEQKKMHPLQDSLSAQMTPVKLPNTLWAAHTESFLRRNMSLNGDFRKQVQVPFISVLEEGYQCTF